MDNLYIWEKVRTVPPTALKEIQAGRLRGKSDINPVWRLKTLTEQFGFCGIGWKYEITEKRLEPGANGEIAAFVDINLYFKFDGAWSEAIPGTGGSSFVADEKNGLYVSDECFKMALTDAISVSCKALGVGADVYWDKDKTKYSGKEAPQETSRLAAPEATQTDVRLEIKQMLWAMSGQDKEEALALLQQFTAFEGKNGKDSMDKVSDKMLPVLLEKVRKAYLGWKKISIMADQDERGVNGE